MYIETQLKFIIVFEFCRRFYNSNTTMVTDRIADQDRFDHLRAVEVKHGRVSMLAVVGYLVTYGRYFVFIFLKIH